MLIPLVRFFRFVISSVDDNIYRLALVIGKPNMVWQSWLKLVNPIGLRNLKTLLRLYRGQQYYLIM